MKQKQGTKILIVDDEEKIRGILAAILGGEGYVVETARDGIDALERVADFRPDVLIVDLQMPRMDGIETIARIKERLPHAAAIVLTAHGSIQSAVQAIKQGAYDYLTKPFDNEQLLMVVRRAGDLVRISTELERLKERLAPREGLGAILGGGELMRATRDRIKKLAATDATVLICGESGTGKELAARAVHLESNRKGEPFVVVDCTAIPEHLVESSFFGHEKGAFTDAREQKTGAFEEANGGTVFLDEIGELPTGAQAKLLRVLQEKEFSRVGSTTPVRVDVRVIAATNKDLGLQVREGRFREDLFYRLDVLKIRMPSLREHPEDISEYVRHFIEKYGTVFGKLITGVTEDALRLLHSRTWKGNVRELENAVQRGLLSAPGDILRESDLTSPAEGDGVASGPWTPGTGLEFYVRALTERTEKRIILESLGRTGWNRTATAAELLISRKTLFNKMQQYGLEEGDNAGGTNAP